MMHQKMFNKVLNIIVNEMKTLISNKSHKTTNVHKNMIIHKFCNYYNNIDFDSLDL